MYEKCKEINTQKISSENNINQILHIYKVKLNFVRTIIFDSRLLLKLHVNFK